MQCLKVTFTELDEGKGAFGPESISPCAFPKYLVLSYDLESKTVFFPLFWDFEYVESGNFTGFYRYQFKFRGDYYLIGVLPKRLVSKVEVVDVDYNPDEFIPDNNLRIMTVRVPLEDKSGVDELIRKYRENNTIVGARSRDGLDLRNVNGKKESFSMWYYELVFQFAGNYLGFFNELQEQIPDFNYTPWSADHNVFPRQRPYYK